MIPSLSRVYRPFGTFSRNLKQNLSVACAVLMFASPALGDFHATLTDVTPTPWVTVNVANTDSLNSFHVSGAIAGQINWSVDSGSTPLQGLGSKFGTFCVEIPRDVYFGTSYNFARTPISNLPTSLQPQTTQLRMGDLKVAQLEALWAANRGTLDVSSASQTAIDYAAFQLAIWKTVYENNANSLDNLSQGNFRASDASTSGVTAQAQVYLQAVQGSHFAADGVTLLSSDGTKALPLANLVGFSLSNAGQPDSQDQIAQVTPAPPAVVLLLSGLVPFMALRRRLLKQPV